MMLAPGRGAADDDIDPWEGVNRPIFRFNDRVDVYILKPIAQGYDFVVPEVVQGKVANFFDNLDFPMLALNNVLQGKFHAAGVDTARFMVNSTFGLAGFFDPASHMDLEKNQEDFGQTLGVWGFPTGPYLVLPFLGPSNPRDTVGLTADSFTAVYAYFLSYYATAGVTAVDVVNWRARSIEDIEQAKATAFDYYVFVRDAYLQRRRTLVNDGEAFTQEEKDDLYYFDE